MLIALLVAALVGGGAWFQFALGDAERVAYIGRARQAYRQVFPLELTPEELSHFDGSDESLPIYLAINGQIYDVSAGADYYKKDGGYGGFSGKDATKAFFDLCFTPECLQTAHCTNLLTESQARELDTWVSFYHNEPKYPYIGRVKYASWPQPECIEAAAKAAQAKASEDSAAKKN